MAKMARGQGGSDGGGAAKDAGSDLSGKMVKSLATTLIDQKKRTERLAHLQEFLSNPSFVDLKEQPLITSSGLDELKARRAETQYRVDVTESLLALMLDELTMLDRAIKDHGKAPAPQTSAPDTDPDQE